MIADEISSWQLDRELKYLMHVSREGKTQKNTYIQNKNECKINIQGDEDEEDKKMKAT